MDSLQLSNEGLISTHSSFHFQWTSLVPYIIRKSSLLTHPLRFEPNYFQLSKLWSNSSSIGIKVELCLYRELCNTTDFKYNIKPWFIQYKNILTRRFHKLKQVATTCSWHAYILGRHVHNSWKLWLDLFFFTEDLSVVSSGIEVFGGKKSKNKRIED